MKWWTRRSEGQEEVVNTRKCRTRRRERGKIGTIGEERLKRGEVKGGILDKTQV